MNINHIPSLTPTQSYDSSVSMSGTDDDCDQNNYGGSSGVITNMNTKMNMSMSMNMDTKQIKKNAPKKALPSTPIRHHHRHHKTRSCHCLPKDKDKKKTNKPPNKALPTSISPPPSPSMSPSNKHNRNISNKKYDKKPLPKMSSPSSPNKSAITIPPSVCSSRSMDQFEEELSQHFSDDTYRSQSPSARSPSMRSLSPDCTPPVLTKIRNHKIGAEIYSNNPLPTPPPLPSRPMNMNRNRSKTLKVAFGDDEDQKCMDGEDCLPLKVFLSHHQGRQLWEEDDIKIDANTPGSRKRRGNRNRRRINKKATKKWKKSSTL